MGNKLKKIRQTLESLRRKGGIKPRELERLAGQLGLKRANRGKEPNWVSDLVVGLTPVSIPNHSGDLNRYTAGGIVDQLELYLEKLEEVYETQIGKQNDKIIQ